MRKEGSLRIGSVLFVIFIAIILIGGVAFLIRAFSGGGSTAPEKNETEQFLANPVEGAKVRMTVRGKITSNEAARSYQVTISPEGRNMTVFSGYTGQQIASQGYGNNMAAYTQFATALDRANMAGTTSTTDTDTRGVCASGKLYTFEILNGDNVLQNTWTTTCDGNKGTFPGNVTRVSNLFLDQIPDRNTLLKGVSL